MSLPNTIDLSRVRIWEWCNELDKHPLQRNYEDVATKLEVIKQERIEKARESRWTNQVTWVHIPANDMLLCQAVLQRLCKPGQYKHLIQQEYWTEQLHEPYNIDDDYSDDEDDDFPVVEERPIPWREELVKAPFMDAKGWAFEFEVMNGGKWYYRGIAKDRDPNATPNSSTIYNSVLYMPFLHWANLDTHNAETKIRHKQSVLSSEQPTDHPRRSLDEAALRQYTYDTLIDKNDSQVVTRVLVKESDRQRLQSTTSRSHKERSKQEEEPKLMVVDQLWLWVLDDDTVVSSFPESPGKHASDDVHSWKPRKCQYLHLECLVRGTFNNRQTEHGSMRLVGCIITRSYSIFRHASLRIPRLRFIDMYKKSIESQRANCADLFLPLQGRKNNVLSRRRLIGNNEKSQKQRLKESRRKAREARDVQNDIAAVADIQDIDEELHIIMHIAQLQIDAISNIVHVRRRFFINELTAFKQEVAGLCEQAKSIHDKLFQTLELKQTLLSARQNQIVLTFTIITIIFLPLGFISSIFGMNATELSDGSPVDLHRIFAYMFPISLAISFIALALAFGSDIADLFELAWQSLHLDSIFSQKHRDESIEGGNTPDGRKEERGADLA